MANWWDLVIRILGVIFLSLLGAGLIVWFGWLTAKLRYERKEREAKAGVPDADPEPAIADRLRDLREDIVTARAADDKKVHLLGLIAERIEAQTVALAQRPVPAEGMPISERLDYFEKFLAKQHTMTMAALDALIEGQEKAAKSHRELMRTFFGNGSGPGYSEIDDESASLRERAEKLQKRYGISWPDAMQQAKAAQVYDPQDGAMRERV